MISHNRNSNGGGVTTATTRGTGPPSSNNIATITSGVNNLRIGSVTNTANSTAQASSDATVGANGSGPTSSLPP